MTGNEKDRTLGDELGGELHRRADGLAGGPLTLGDVKARAGSIRRTRRLATAAGLAAVVAVVVPMAMFARGGDRADGPLPATNGPSAPRVPSTGPTRATDPDTVDPTGAPTLALDADHSVGAAPAVPWLDGTTLSRPGVAAVELPERYVQFVVLGDRVAGLRYDDSAGDLVLDDVGADGSVTSTAPGVQGLAVDPAGTTAAWIDADGDLETMCCGGGGQAAAGLGAATAAAILSDGACDAGCRVFVNGPANHPPQVVDANGDATDVGLGARQVEDASVAGTVAVLTSVSDTGSCSGVLDPGLGAYLWTTCDHSLLGFSPAGTLLAATGPYRDGFGLSTVTVLDAADGAPLVDFAIDGGAILQTAWEDESHLLAVTYDDRHGWRILRLGTDGSIETAVGPDGASQDDRPYFLAGRQ